MTPCDWLRGWQLGRTQKGTQMAEGLRRSQLGTHAISDGHRRGAEGEMGFVPPTPTIILVGCFRGPEEFLDRAWEDILASAEMAVAVLGLPGLLNPTERTLSELRTTFSICLAIRWPKEAHLVHMAITSRNLGDDPLQEPRVVVE